MQVAAKALETAVFGAFYNVMINLKDVTDESFRDAVSTSTQLIVTDLNADWSQTSYFFCVLKTQRRASALLLEAKDSAAAILDAAEKRK